MTDYYEPPTLEPDDSVPASTAKLRRARAMALSLGRKIVDLKQITLVPIFKHLLGLDRQCSTFHWLPANSYITLKQWDEDAGRQVSGYVMKQVPISCAMVPHIEELLHDPCWHQAKRELIRERMELNIRGFTLKVR